MSKSEHPWDDHEPLPDGEEAPPPLTHTMGIVRWCLLSGMTLFAILMVLSYFGMTPWAAESAEATKYHCPMHPTYVSAQPGDCPICGMSLVPIPKDSTTESAPDSIKSMPKATPATIAKPGQYTCPMHPKVISDSAGKCPDCGMFLEKVKEPAAKTAEYVCPMHPEVKSDKPGKCPKCGMKLEKAPTSKTGEKTLYSCPMHPEVISDKPGKCPKCGMFLEKGEKETPQKEEFVCPMHPDVISDHAGDCPKCGMKLEPKPSSDATMDLQGGGMAEEWEESAVPGLASVMIDTERLQLIGLKTARVGKHSSEGMLSIVGLITPDETKMKNMHVRVSGWVLNLYADKTGQAVRTGEPLLSIYSQELYQAEQDFITAKSTAARSVGDSMMSSVSAQLVAAARERLFLMGLTADDITKLESSAIPSAEIILRSPFSGFILEKSVLPGQFLTPDLALYTIADLSAVWVVGDVYEQDFAAVRIGQKGTLRLAAFPGEHFEGTVDYIYPLVSEETRTLKIRLRFPNPEFRLKPGMYADISLSYGGETVLAMPIDALLDGGETQYAFVVHDGIHFEPRRVTVGRSFDNWVEIRAGLSEGEEIVTSANFLIDSESRLKAALSGMEGAPEESPQPAGHQH